MKWFPVLCLLLVGLRANAQTPYRYAYMTQTATHEIVLHLVSMDGEIDSMTLPNSENDFTYAEASPDGQMVFFFMSHRADWADFYSPSETAIRLLDMTTGEMYDAARVVPPYDDDFSGLAIPIWSPDGSFLAFNGSLIESPIVSGAYVYSIDEQRLFTIPIEADEPTTGGTWTTLAHIRQWAPDSHRLMMTSQRCFARQLEARNCPNPSAIVISVPDMVRQAEVVVNTYGLDLCQVEWSPDGRYISFRLFCSYIGIGTPFFEMFAWDTTTHDVRQLTTYTNLFPTEWTEYPPDRYARYEPIWVDAETLLTGVKAWEVTMGVGVQPDSLVTETVAVQVAEGDITALVEAYASDWAVNPLTGEIAFRLEDVVVDEGGIPRVVDAASVIAWFDDGRLVIQRTLPEGFNLAWSPDGNVLSYVTLAMDSEETCKDCLSAHRNLTFWRGGDITTHSLPHDDSLRLLGWVVVPEMLTTPFFPAGTPTPIPTADPLSCCG